MYYNTPFPRQLTATGYTRSSLALRYYIDAGYYDTVYRLIGNIHRDLKKFLVVMEISAADMVIILKSHTANFEVKASDRLLFNNNRYMMVCTLVELNACQFWNHNLFWPANSSTPGDLTIFLGETESGVVICIRHKVGWSYLRKWWQDLIEPRCWDDNSGVLIENLEASWSGP